MPKVMSETMGKHSVYTLAIQLGRALRDINLNDEANRIDAILADINQYRKPISKCCGTCKHWKSVTATLGECDGPLRWALYARPEYTQDSYICDKWENGCHDNQ